MLGFYILIWYSTVPAWCRVRHMARLDAFVETVVNKCFVFPCFSTTACSASERVTRNQSPNHKFSIHFLVYSLPLVGFSLCAQTSKSQSITLHVALSTLANGSRWRIGGREVAKQHAVTLTQNGNRNLSGVSGRNIRPAQRNISYLE